MRRRGIEWRLETGDWRLEKLVDVFQGCQQVGERREKKQNSVRDHETRLWLDLVEEWNATPAAITKGHLQTSDSSTSNTHHSDAIILRRDVSPDGLGPACCTVVFVVGLLFLLVLR